MSLAPHRTRSTSSSAFSSVPGLPRLLTSRIPCADPREPRGDGKTDPEPRTGYEPDRIVDNEIINAQEVIRTLSYNQSLLSSTQDSVEALLRLKKQTRTTNKLVLCWLHHVTYRSDKQVRNDRMFITLKEGLMFSSSQGLNFIGTSRPVAFFFISEKVESRRDFRERVTCWCFRE